MNAVQNRTVEVALRLLAAGPAYYKDLAPRLFEAGIKRRGTDPVYTVYADLFFDAKSASPRVKMIGRGVFALVDDEHDDGSEFAPSRSQAPATVESLTAQIARLQAQLKELSK